MQLIDASHLIEKNYKKNQKRVIKLNKEGTAFVQCLAAEQSSLEIFQLLSDIHQVIKVYGSRCKKIVIAIGHFNPADKLVYILIESIVYTLLNVFNIEVGFFIKEFKHNINTAGWIYTPLKKAVEAGIIKSEFNLAFHNDFSKNHYRRVLRDPEDMEATSALVTDIKTFLNRFHMKDEFDNNFALVIGELVDNAFGHARTPCLVDIDITENDFKNADDQDDKVYYGINAVVLNYSDKCLYDDIMDKIEHKYYKDESRYKNVEKAYRYHKNFFQKGYSKEDFFLISAFQDEISGRPHESYSGGTGLPELVRTLEEAADGDYCYVLSGKNSLLFLKEYLDYSKEGWIGFNESGNYEEDIPDLDCISSSYTFLPGTGYNFMLVFEGEKDYE